MRHPLLLTLAAASGLGLAALAVHRVVSDRSARAVEAGLLRHGEAPRSFSSTDLRGLPEPARRYLQHAVAPGTPLVSACRLWMDGTMKPSPGALPTAITAVETLAPRAGFVWTAAARMAAARMAAARMAGLPVRVRDYYHRGVGGVTVTALGILPVPIGGAGADVARSCRGRLIGEAVWCPTALVHPDVAWEAVGDNHARFTLVVDGDSVAVTLHVAGDGALREVTLDRWGDPDGGPPRRHPCGFRVDAEGTLDGVTIPTRITGGWSYGTDGYDPTSAASFAVHHAELAPASPH